MATATITCEAILAAHGLTDCLTAQLPPLRARNHTEAVAAIAARRASLLEHAHYLAFLASAFADVPEVVEILAAEAEAALAQAHRIAPKAVTA